MKTALLILLVGLSCGCTVNIYWTDNVVYGELRLDSQPLPKREPIPLELKVRE